MLDDQSVTLREFLDLRTQVEVIKSKQIAADDRISLVSGAQRKIVWMIVSAIVLAVLNAAVLKGV